MKKNLVLGAGRGPRLAVLERVKRSGNGMSVKELSKALGMSYMGVKAHCVALTSAGYLETWRMPAPKGRPVMLYRLADAGETLFAGSGEEFALQLLREAAGLFGATAPQKLLMMHFRTLTTHYQSVLNDKGVSNGGGVRERVLAFVRTRDREGRMSSLEEVTKEAEGEGKKWQIRECHNPLSTVISIYPEASAMEEAMVGDVLGVPMRRTENGGVLLFSPR